MATIAAGTTTVVTIVVAMTTAGAGTAAMTTDFGIACGM